MIKKLSSADNSYKAGQLSVFPKAKDSKGSLFEAKNNAEDILQQTLAINSKYITLIDGSKFPNSGIIKITDRNSKTLLSGFELVYYGRRVGNQLHLLHRGYNGSSPNSWPAGSKVCCPVMAEHHNALKDAIIKIQQKIGLSDKPSKDSINGILGYLETKWLSPKPIFKAYPAIGPASLMVTFHNFSLGHGGRYLWDFGDGTTSTETNPTHIYENSGKYTVRLTMTSENGSQGLTEKTDFIEVNNNFLESFLHVSPTTGDINTEFKIIDQSDGDIVERHWYFGDGEQQSINNPNIHSIVHKYSKPGKYLPSLIIRMADNKTRRTFLPEGIVVNE